MASEGDETRRVNLALVDQKVDTIEGNVSDMRTEMREHHEKTMTAILGDGDKPGLAGRINTVETRQKFIWGGIVTAISASIGAFFKSMFK